MTVKSIRLLRQAQGKHNFDIEKQDTMYRSVQFDLLRDYRSKNRETNLLYFDFNMKAKILYVAQTMSH